MNVKPERWDTCQNCGCVFKILNMGTEPIRYLICGDRNWNNFKIIDSFLATLLPNSVIIEGDCRGADKISGYLARKRGLEVIPVQANWEYFKKAAGPERNQRMLDEYKPDVVVAFHNNIANSHGTKDMISRALEAKLPVLLFQEDGAVFQITSNR